MYTESDISVDACVTVKGTCPAEYVICGDFVEFHFGERRDGFHFAFDASALRKLVGLGGEALDRMDALPTGSCAGDGAALAESPGDDVQPRQ